MFEGKETVNPFSLAKATPVYIYYRATERMETPIRKGELPNKKGWRQMKQSC